LDGTGGQATPVAVVTGAARGIGAAVARRLSAAGWRLVLLDRCENDPALQYPLSSRADLERNVEACGGPDGCEAVVGDVRSQSDLRSAVDSAMRRYGRLDAAVSVAGAIAGGTESWATSDETWEAMISVNLEGPWRLAKAAVPAMLDSPQPRHGRYVAVTSSAGMVGIPLLGAYSAAKHGVLGLVRSLAAELAPHGVTANAVAPGSTSGFMLDASAAIYGLDSPGEFAQHHLLARLIDPDEPAALIAWLCSRESSAVTGALLPVDAGMTSR
jgi:SDR family mycofactocin-dependent oxidoreductase